MVCMYLGRFPDATYLFTVFFLVFRLASAFSIGRLGARGWVGLELRVALNLRWE